MKVIIDDLTSHLVCLVASIIDYFQRNYGNRYLNVIS